jgi:phage terminase large subunit-like protein
MGENVASSAFASLLAARTAAKLPSHSRWYCDRSECDGKPHDGWQAHARTAQRPPVGDWFVWLMLAGRGFGKTRAGAEWLAEQARTHPNSAWGLIAPTWSDVRKCVRDPEAGLLDCLGADLGVHNITTGTVTLKNGSIIHCVSADQPDRLRGYNLWGAWVDELSSWRNPEAWSTMVPALRVGSHPRIAATTTPKAVALIRDLVGRHDGSVVIVRGSTWDNADNLAPSALAELRTRYEGTRIGRQELEGELLEDVPGALWTLELFEDREVDGRVLVGRVDEAPEMRRLVVGVDPSGADSGGQDECGILVAGKGVDGHGYTIADRTITASPAVWARRAVAAYREFGADKIVAEGNYGGLMVVETIKAVDKSVPVEIVTASRSKRQRAEPVAALYEQGRIHHVGQLAKLEDELISWTPESGWSPGRMDALVWAISWLNLAGNAAGEGYSEFLKLKAAEPTVCQGRPNGHHLWRDGLCTLCNEPKEAA